MFGIGVFIFYIILKFFLAATELEVTGMPTLAWITAVVIMTASVYGCCIVQTENPKLVSLYAGFILTCIVFQIAIPSIFYAQRTSIAKQLFISNVARNFTKAIPVTQNFVQKLQQDVRFWLLY